MTPLRNPIEGTSREIGPAHLRNNIQRYVQRPTIQSRRSYRFFEMLPRQCRPRRDRAEILFGGYFSSRTVARSCSIREPFHIRVRDERQLPKARSLVNLGGSLVAEDRTGLVGYLVVQLGATTIATVETRHEDIH